MTPRLRDLALLLATASSFVAACRRDAPPAPQPAPPVATAQPSATPVVPPAPSSPTPPALPPGVLCLATPAASFHLRPTATDESVGPELAAGTSLGVTGVDDEHTRRGTQMYAVTVVATGAAGHAFLSSGELAADCPPAIRQPADAIACQERCAAPLRAEHDRCLTTCTNSGERGSECLDSCQSEAFTSCMRAQCNEQEPPRMW